MNTRNYNMDVLKALAIISVILLHSLTFKTELKILAPYHIKQAVPVFMILTGYNTARSYQKRGFKTLPQFYEFNYLRKRLERLIYPFVFIWLLQMLILFLFTDKLDLSLFIRSFFRGGRGPGSYFVPIIVQTTLLLPFIYLFLKKNKKQPVLIIFLVSLGLELFSRLTDMGAAPYRLLIFRYVFALTLGVWLAMNDKKVNYKWLAFLSIVSFIYITAVNYFDWIFIMEKYWEGSHAPAYFWTLLIVIIGLKLPPVRIERKVNRIFVKIGQASYHIFLAQMVYFWRLKDLLPPLPPAVKLSLNMVLCLVLGLLFFELEKIVWKRAISKN